MFRILFSLNNTNVTFPLANRSPIFSGLYGFYYLDSDPDRTTVRIEILRILDFTIRILKCSFSFRSKLILDCNLNDPLLSGDFGLVIECFLLEMCALFSELFCYTTTCSFGMETKQGLTFFQLARKFQQSVRTKPKNGLAKRTKKITNIRSTITINI